MSFGARYRTTIKDARSRVVTITLEKDGYAGTVSTFELAAEAAERQTSKQGSSVLTAIRSSILTLNVAPKSTSVVDEVYATTAAWRIRTEIAGTTHHYGPLRKEKRSATRDRFQRSNTLLSYCGLGLLQENLFTGADGSLGSVYALGRKSRLYWILFILNKLGLGLPLSVATDLYAYGMATGTDPLDQEYIYPEALNRFEKNPRTCFQVLEDLLGPRFFITQEGGYWHIYSREQFLSAAFQARVYPANYFEGGAATTRQHTAQTVVPVPGYSYREPGSETSPLDTFGSAEILYPHGRVNYLIPNGSFSDGDGDNITGWELAGGAAGVVSGSERLSDGSTQPNRVLSVPVRSKPIGDEHPDENYLSAYARTLNAIAFALSGSSKLDLRGYAMVRLELSRPAGVAIEYTKVYPVYLQVSYQVGGTTYYLQPPVGVTEVYPNARGLRWVASAQRLFLKVAILGGSNEALSLQSEDLPGNGALSIACYGTVDEERAVSGGGTVPGAAQAVEWDALDAVILGDLTLMSRDKQRLLCSIGAGARLEALTLPFGTGPTPMHRAATFSSSGAMLDNWKIGPYVANEAASGITEQQIVGRGILEALSSELLEAIDGTYVAQIDTSCVRAIVEGSRVYLPVSVLYNYKSARTQVSAPEVHRDQVTVAYQDLPDEKATTLGPTTSGSTAQTIDQVSGSTYSKTESDARFEPKGTLHDDRYYTETESDARFASKAHNHAGVYAEADHLHQWEDITNPPSVLTSLAAGSGILVEGYGAGRTISHDDTSAQASVAATGSTVIQQVILDNFGHVTGLNTKQLTPALIGAAAASHDHAGQYAPAVHYHALDQLSDVAVSGGTYVEGMTLRIRKRQDTGVFYWSAENYPIGDMAKSVYDPNNNGWVDRAARAFVADAIYGPNSTTLTHTDFARTGHTHNSLNVQDVRDTNPNPSAYDTVLYPTFKTNAADGLGYAGDTSGYHGVLNFRPYGSGNDFSGGPMYQLGFSSSGNLSMRMSTGPTTWDSWVRFWHSGNLAPVQATGGTMTGPLVMNIGTSDAGVGHINFRQSGKDRFVIGLQSAYADLKLWRYWDDGSYAGNPLTISRDTGAVTFDRTPYVSDATGTWDVWHKGNFNLPSYLNQAVRTTDSPTFSNAWLSNHATARGYAVVPGGSLELVDNAPWYGIGMSNVVSGNGTMVQVGGYYGLRMKTAGNVLVLGQGAGDISLNGSKVWHAGNGGPGTGLHADLIDNHHINELYSTQGIPFSVGGSGSVFYPVAFYTDSGSFTDITIYKGIHDPVSWDGSMRLDVRVANYGWGSFSDGIGGVTIRGYSYHADYPQHMAKWSVTGSGGYYFVVWLRGARNYVCRTSNNKVPRVCLTDTDLDGNGSTGAPVSSISHDLPNNYRFGRGDWDKHLFSDYLNQAVRTDSTPTFFAATLTRNGSQLEIRSPGVQYGVYATDSGYYLGRWDNTGMLWYNNTSNRWNFNTSQYTNGTIEASGDIVASASDRRLKSNLRPITLRPLDLLDNLNGYRYEWLTNAIGRQGQTDVGLVAQEVQSVLPEAVAEREDGYLTIKHDRVVPLLVEALKEARRRIVQLEQICGVA